MASKQVQDLLVRLKIDGLKGLDSLKGAFRELAKTIGPTEQTIEKARQSIIEFGEAGTKSEQLIKGQIAALKGLQNQATQNGEVYNKLTSNIKALENVAYGASAAVEEQRKRLTAFGASADATALQVQQTINALIRLRGETRIDSDAFNKFGESVATLTNRFKAVSQEAQNFADAQRRIVRPIGASSAAAKQQIRDLELVTEALRDQRDELGALEGQARVRVGVAGLAERGAPASGRRTFEEALAESLFGEDIKKLLPAKDIKAALDEVSRQIVEFQQEIETNLSRGIQRSFQETARAGRESARAMAAAFSSPELLGVFDRLDQRLGELPQTATGFSQRLRELQQVFANTAASAENYISVALEIARVQRQASATAQGLGAALVRDLDTGVAVRNKKNLQEAIGQLQAEMNELDTQTTEGARAYAENANQARALESQLRQLGNSYRHVADMATQAATAQTSEATARVTANYMNRALIRQQEQAMTELGQRVRAGVAGTPLALPAAGGTTAPGTGQAISGGARRLTGPIETTFDVSGRRMARTIGERSGYYNPPTAATGAAAAVGQSAEAINRANKSYSNLIVNLREVLLASNGSISSLNRQRSAWSALREAVDPVSKQFANSTKQIEALDARLGKLQQTQRRRMGGMQMAQAAGAAISGGIFGGPEGFLGGAIGGITGGVGGAFVGAAAGAQVGMLRQQLSGFADYAAQIQKMEIALKNAAGSQDQFNQAVAAANSVVRNLNVPQDVAIQGMTRLTAAVKGAGGQVSDAELVFKNVTSAIKATGGSAEDVDGAITAMVQVFSKGKVSAEELSGQLGERLPGAVTKFAKANDMTLPELQKALEQGQVGLNELMNFIVQLGDEYAGVAGQIASSSQDAGARLTVAFNDMRIAVGEALQPIGAEFQEAFIPFIESITPALVAVLPVIGDLALGVVKNLDVLAASLGALAAGAIVNAISLTGGLGVAFASLKTAILATNAALLLNPWVALAAGIAAATVAIIKHSQAQKEYNNLLDNGAGSSNELRSTQRDLEAQIAAARKALEGSGNSMGATGRQAMQLKMKIAELENQLARINKTFAIRLKLEREGFEFDESGRTRYYTVAGVTYDIKTRAPVRGTQTPNEFPRLAEDGSGSSKAKKERESQLPQLQAQLAVQQQIAQINAKIRDAQLAENQFLQIRLEGERELAQIAGEIKALAFEKIPANEIEEKRKLLMLKADEARLDIALRLQQVEKQNLIEITQQSNELAKSYTTQIEDRQRLQELIATGMKEALALEYIQIENILKIEKERLEVRKALLEAAGDVGGAQETQDLIDRLGGKESDLKGLAADAQETEKGKLQQFIEQAEAELKDLEALAVRISQNIGNAVGNSIANGITGLIEGTTTAKEVFANFLKDVGQILIQEGAKMIATYIAIGLAKMFAGLFGGGGGGGGGEVPGALGQATNTGLDTGAGNISDMLSGLAAKGAYFSGGQADFAQNSIQPFAMGGIVTRPTFFKYADGGTFNNGVMGEAGPEAIMPLKRGADGKLGVAARLDGAMSRYRRPPGTAGDNATADGTSESAGAVASAGPIDVRYTVERINSVDYVTADQFQAGMAQAAQQGARQGEQSTLRRLQQSSSTRRRLGM